MAKVKVKSKRPNAISYLITALTIGVNLMRKDGKKKE